MTPQQASAVRSGHDRSHGMLILRDSQLRAIGRLLQLGALTDTQAARLAQAISSRNGATSYA